MIDCKNEKSISRSHVLYNRLLLQPREDGESHTHPPTKCSRPPDNKRRVTFDPVVQERKVEADSDTSHATASFQPVTLKEAADIVVRILDPFYKKGKFATKVSVRVSSCTCSCFIGTEYKAQDCTFCL